MFNNCSLIFWALLINILIYWFHSLPPPGIHSDFGWLWDYQWRSPNGNRNRSVHEEPSSLRYSISWRLLDRCATVILLALQYDFCLKTFSNHEFDITGNVVYFSDIKFSPNFQRFDTILLSSSSSLSFYRSFQVRIRYESPASSTV